MKQRVKSVLFFCLYYSGLEFILARLIRVRGVAVLMYHGVCEKCAIPEPINFHLTPEIFEKQMRVLKKRYSVRRLSEVVDELKSGKPVKTGVVLTFDDGYSNNAHYVAPILDRLQLRFSVFITTGYIDSGKWMPLNQVYGMWHDGQLEMEEVNRLRKQLRERPSSEATAILSEVAGNFKYSSKTSEENFGMLSWAEIRRLAGAGVEIGSHTVDHCNMAAESKDSQLRQLSESKQRLEAQLESSVNLFAYPYGHSEHMSESSRQSVIDIGYDCALSTERGIVTSESDRFCLPRLGYERPIWRFAGDILFEFLRQQWKGSVKVACEKSVAQQSAAGTNLG